MPEIQALADNVVKIRKTMHLNQAEFSWEVGISIEELSLIERGKANPRLLTLQKIAAFTGLSVSDLLQVDEDSDIKTTADNQN